MIDSPKVENCPTCAITCARQERIKLAGVKTGLYNPNLVSLRRVAMDDFRGKLPDEHSRTTVRKEVAELPQELFYNYNPSCSYIPQFDVLPLPSKASREQQALNDMSLNLNDELKKAYLGFRGHLPLAKGRLVDIPEIRRFHYLNYQIRYLRPEERQKWRNFTGLKPEHQPAVVSQKIPEICSVASCPEFVRDPTLTQ